MILYNLCCFNIPFNKVKRPFRTTEFYMNTLHPAWAAGSAPEPTQTLWLSAGLDGDGRLLVVPVLFWF